MRKMALLVAAALAVGAADAAAQNVTARVTIPQVLGIDVSNDGGVVTFPQPDETSYDPTTGLGTLAADAGTGSTVSTFGNVPHDVEVRALASAFTYTGTGIDPVKPASHLQWSTDGTTWNPMSDATGDVVASGSRGVNADLVVIQYQMALDLAFDVPGQYDLQFVYTLVAN